jgi:hypothetical protein
MGHSRSYLEDLGIFRKCYDHLLLSGNDSMLQKYSRNFVMIQEGLGMSMINYNYVGEARILEQTQVRPTIIQKLLRMCRIFLETLGLSRGTYDIQEIYFSLQGVLGSATVLVDIP